MCRIRPQERLLGKKPENCAFILRSFAFLGCFFDGFGGFSMVFRWFYVSFFKINPKRGDDEGITFSRLLAANPAEMVFEGSDV